MDWILAHLDVITALGLVMSFAMHYVARKTKNTYDDRLAELFDLLRAQLPKPPTDPQG